MKIADVGNISYQEMLNLWKIFLQPFFILLIITVILSLLFRTRPQLTVEKIIIMAKISFYGALLFVMLMIDIETSTFGLKNSFTFLDVFLIPLALLEVISNFISLFK